MPATKISAMPSVSSLLGSEVFPVVQFGTNKKSTILDIVNYFPLSGVGSTGLLTSTDWTTFNNKQSSLTIGNLSETGSSILTITGGTGAIIGSGLTIQVKQATTSQNGFLSSTDWNTFNSKGNGTVTSVDLITGTTGTDVNVSGSPITSSGSITLNIPDASATARGLITTGTQTLAGSKTFSSAPTFSTMTPGSVFFAGTSGLLSQDNASLFWDDTNNRLGINTTTPSQSLQIIGGYAQTQTVTTISGAAGAQSVALIIAPTTNSSGQHRAYNMSNQHNAPGINFSGLQTTAAWFENRVINSGTHAELNGVIATGLLLATNSISCGTVTSSFGMVGVGVNQFNTNSLTTTITNAVSIYASDQNKNTCTITNSCGVMIGTQSKGTNNTDILIGTTTIPSGTWSIYGASANNNHINGKLFIGTTTDAGYKLDVNGTTRSVTSIESPIVRGNTTASGTLTLSSTSNATKGNIIFGASAYDEVNNRLGIGTSSPESMIHNISTASGISTTDSPENLRLDRYVANSPATAPTVILRKARGTFSLPSAVASGDTIGVFGFRGHNGTAMTTGSRAYLIAYASENWTTTANGTYLAYGTTANGTTTGTERLRIDQDGSVLIGTTTNAGYKLDVNGTTQFQDNITLTDSKNIIFNTTTGTKIGTATSQKIGFWNATPIVQPTTSVGSATYASPGAGSTIKTDDTFDGYTLQQVVKALRNTGILA